MSVFDYAVIVVYILSMMFIGLYYQKKAKQNIDAYFLGQRTLPWWALGASGMASNLDVSGTMINTALIFSLGVGGFFVEFRGGVVLVMAFLMVFMGKWSRRSQVMTMGEWMHFRFGDGFEGNIARFLAALATLVSTIGMVAYFALGAGKFLGEFLGLPAFLGLSSDFWAATLMIVLAMIYTVASGLYGVVWTDVFQGILIFIAIIYISTVSILHYSIPETFSISVPLKTGGFQAIETTREAWTSVVPSWKLNIPEESSYSIFNYFGIAIFFYLFKVAFEGCSGAQGYMLQRYLAAKSDREAGLLSLLWTGLLAFRWPFTAALAIMAISLGANGQPIDDPEKVLPIVLNTIVPIGMKGLMIAGLMSAAMSTFDSTINAGASYWVRDIYQAHLNPQADQRRLLIHSRLASVVIVVLGLGLSLTVQHINDIWGWLTMSLGGGLMVPLLIRWYWWRMNGLGFAVGTGVGMIASNIQMFYFPGVPEYEALMFSAGLSLAGTILGTYLAPPTKPAVLDHFYRVTRPFGFWGPIRDRLPKQALVEVDRENHRDLFALCFAVPWQVVLFIMLMMIVMGRWDNFAILLVLFGILSYGLYMLWYRHLSAEVKIEDESIPAQNLE